MDSSDYYDVDPGLIEGFPAAQNDLRATPRLGIYGEPHSHFWTLQRGGEPVAIVSIEGKFYYKSGKVIDLTSAYAQHARRLIPMTITLLKQWL